MRSFSSGPGLGDFDLGVSDVFERLFPCAQSSELPLDGWMKFSGLVMSPFSHPKVRILEGIFSLPIALKNLKSAT